MIFLFGAVLLVIGIVWRSLLSTPADDSIYDIDYNQISFAWEKMPIDGPYLFNKEKFDREYAISLLNAAQFVMIYRREAWYRDFIVEQLRQANIPEDFFYLVVAESALRNNSVSNAGAAWLWQFMPETARSYGLVVNNQIDERYHITKSTDAAIRYLKKLYQDFGNWTLVAAAYNRGENGLKRDLESQRVTWYYDVVLNDETARYVFRIMALKTLSQKRYEMFSPHVLWQKYPLPEVKYVVVGAVKDLVQRSLDQWITYKILREYNPRIIGRSLPKGERTIALPAWS